MTDTTLPEGYLFQDDEFEVKKPGSGDLSGLCEVWDRPAGSDDPMIELPYRAVTAMIEVQALRGTLVRIRYEMRREREYGERTGQIHAQGEMLRAMGAPSSHQLQQFDERMEHRLERIEQRLHQVERG